ncbi:MAG TPA: helix-turn-helix transcriptional regulator [Syntrophales bacterium]|nr:helix-turn-helix transcriptional regulator [Syntrophales bacterium]
MKDDPFTQQNKKRKRYISALLVLHNISQAELARRIGVSKGFFSLVVTGRRGGTRKKGPLVNKVRQAVADALGMTVAELWPEKKGGAE